MSSSLGFRGFSSLRGVAASKNFPHRIASTLRTRQALNLFTDQRSFAAVAAPAAIRIHEFLNELWGSILRAVPKKKTSHSKKRSRQLAGKALKDVKSLNQCSACGRIKRMHFLCPHCVQNIKDIWVGRTRVPPVATRTDKPN